MNKEEYNLDPMVCEDPIFVIGTPRSGTTLVSKILGRHSKLYFYGETHFFSDVYCRRQQLGNPPGDAMKREIFDRVTSLYARYNEHESQAMVNHLLRDEENTQKLLSACGTGYREALACFMGLQMEKNGKSRWGDHTPRDVFHYSDILDLFPRAAFLVCVRDPRDFLRSYKGKWRQSSIDQRERLGRLYHPVVTSLLWRSSMRTISAMKDTISDENIMLVRYEELVARPKEMSHLICQQLGVTFEPGMTEVTESNSSEETSGNGIYATSVGLWREQLTKEEVAVCEKINYVEMDAFGYDKADPQCSTIGLSRLYMSTPFHIIRALYSNRKNIGPLVPYVLDRLKGIFA